MMDCFSSSFESVPSYGPLLKAAFSIPISHYFFGAFFIFLLCFCHFLEIHFFRDLLTGFAGQPVSLTFHSSSPVYHFVASKCKILHSRYLSTPWLCSPHLQTAFLTFFGRPPAYNYTRELFKLADGGTIALDWLMHTDVMKPGVQENGAIIPDGKVPIMIVIPGLTSDSDAAYVRHLTFKMAKCGWNVVVSNHRGLGGVSLTSDCFYNAGWTQDIRKVIEHIHCQHPEAPLFTVGTSIGANILVKYLGEEGLKTPIIGAAAICSPWDLLICDRFISRRLVQRFYDKALTFGLKGFAQLHQSVLSRLADWEGITKSRSVRDFDNYATRLVGKYETVDTYYRRCSSAGYVGNVMVPLLCISAIDDPVCTREAIPWDECRANKNIILATTQHGGHLAYFEGITAKSVWWVRAVDEFFSILNSNPLIHTSKEMQVASPSPEEISIDQAPYVNVVEDGMVTAIGNGQLADMGHLNNDNMASHDKAEDAVSAVAAIGNGQTTQVRSLENDNCIQHDKAEDKLSDTGKNGETPNVAAGHALASGRNASDIIAPVKRCVDKLSRHSRKSMWLLAYIAIITTWPVVGSALLLFFKKKFRTVFSRTSLGK
nr:phospholipase ABHD3 [Coffea arabica]